MVMSALHKSAGMLIPLLNALMKLMHVTPIINIPTILNVRTVLITLLVRISVCLLMVKKCAQLGISQHVASLKLKLMLLIVMRILGDLSAHAVGHP